MIPSPIPRGLRCKKKLLLVYLHFYALRCELGKRGKRFRGVTGTCMAQDRGEHPPGPPFRPDRDNRPFAKVCSNTACTDGLCSIRINI